MSATLQDTHLQFTRHLEENGKAHATVIAYSKDIEQFIDFLKAASKVETHDVASEDIDSFKELLKKQRYTGKSVSRKINSIKAYFRYLINQGILSDNPSDTVSHPKFDQS